MKYQIEFAPLAARQFKILPQGFQARVKKRIDSLSDNPRPAGVQKLEGIEDLYRIRVGDYRVIYQIQDKALLILVVKIGHRREVYR